MIQYPCFGRAVLLAVAILFAGGAHAQRSASAPKAAKDASKASSKAVAPAPKPELEAKRCV